MLTRQSDPDHPQAEASPPLPAPVQAVCARVWNIPPARRTLLRTAHFATPVATALYRLDRRYVTDRPALLLLGSPSTDPDDRPVDFSSRLSVPLVLVTDTDPVVVESTPTAPDGSGRLRGR